MKGNEPEDELEGLPFKEYVGFVWLGDDPGIRLSFEARSSTEAGVMVRAEYGEDCVFSVWNEGDARKPR